MAPLILIGLIAVPALELAVIISVGGAIGVWPTVISVFLTAIIGIGLIKPQSRTLIDKLRHRIEAGETPQEETFHGICLAFAGLFLLFPGFVTDFLGFLLLLPFIREWMFAWLHKRANAAQAGQQADRPPVIDGDFEEIDDDPPPPPRGGWG